MKSLVMCVPGAGTHLSDSMLVVCLAIANGWDGNIFVSQCL